MGVGGGWELWTCSFQGEKCNLSLSSKTSLSTFLPPSWTRTGQDPNWSISQNMLLSIHLYHTFCTHTPFFFYFRKDGGTCNMLYACHYHLSSQLITKLSFSLRQAVWQGRKEKTGRVNFETAGEEGGGGEEGEDFGRRNFGGGWGKLSLWVQDLSVKTCLPCLCSYSSPYIIYLSIYIYSFFYLSLPNILGLAGSLVLPAHEATSDNGESYESVISSPSEDIEKRRTCISEERPLPERQRTHAFCVCVAACEPFSVTCHGSGFLHSLSLSQYMKMKMKKGEIVSLSLCPSLS